MRGTLLALVLVTVGCRRDGRPEDVLPRHLLEAADAAWDARATEGFQPVEDLLGQALVVAPNSPEVLWRLARLFTGMGMAALEPREERAQYALARGRAIECLEGNEAFAQRRAEIGWSEAVAVIRASREPCLTWGAFAWSRWYAAYGTEAAALDVAPIDALLAGAAERAPAERQERVAWGRAILLATRPSIAGRNLEAAQRLFEQLVARAPDDLGRRVDLLAYVLLPTGDATRAEEQRAAVRERPASMPEDAGAKARLERLEARVAEVP